MPSRRRKIGVSADLGLLVLWPLGVQHRIRTNDHDFLLVAVNDFTRTDMRGEIMMVRSASNRLSNRKHRSRGAPRTSNRRSGKPRAWRWPVPQLSGHSPAAISHILHWQYSP